MSDGRSHKQVLVLRKDLKMPTGKMIAQGAHASLSAVLSTSFVQEVNGKLCRCIPLDDGRMAPWLEGQFTKVALSIDSEDALLALYEKAKSEGKIASLIQDSGFTVFNGVKTFTAVAIGPDAKDSFEGLTSNLSLLR